MTGGVVTRTEAAKGTSHALYSTLTESHGKSCCRREATSHGDGCLTKGAVLARG